MGLIDREEEVNLILDDKVKALNSEFRRNFFLR